MAKSEMLFRQQVISLLSKECKAAGSQAAWAKLHNLHAPHVSDMLAGRRVLSAQLLRALGFERMTMYRRTK
jgi:DNA-binding transcriptional regulator YdaS (Cro superfamily)